ncbi:hypothetical protein P879_08712 [Paragonimus westermani]|uniref:Trafficking protein particle complex subunit 8 n=1 Tax=Paragonimus westermani TaxID=34504 RepID=A0A8T0D2R2_9TREM|nr:hypothetical protein P879_08712 [Paragonimus westermani]
MASCPSSGEKFVNFVFSPCVALFVTSDVESICSKANLSFSELLKPFSQLSKDVTIRDNNNLLHTVTSLRVNFLDTSSPLVSIASARSHLRQIVTACSTDFSIPSSTYSNGKLSACVPSTIPWFEAWRYVFIKSLRPSVHEFLGHCLASIFVVSSTHSDPVEALSTLSKQQQVQSQQQQQSSHQSGDNHPCWFGTNVATFFVLVHIPAQVSQTKVDEQFAQMERVFGAANCYLLTLFSEGTKPATLTAVPSSLANGSVRPQSESNQGLSDPVFHSTQTADPWLSHLLPHGYRIPVVRPDSPIPTQPDLLETTASTVDPLSARNGVHLINADGLGHLDQLNVDLKQCSFLSPRLHQPHGVGLSQSDLDRIRLFVYDFVVRCLIPWVEQTMRGLNEQIAYRMRLSRSFFSATKKFFSSAVGGGGSNSHTGTGSSAQLFTTAIMSPATTESVLSSSSTPNLIGMIGSGGNMPAVSSETVMARNSTLMNESESREDVARILQQSPTGSVGPTVVYSPDAPEMQMRRLADLAFLFQQYEVAYQTYNVLKRDFQNDTAWIYYAGVQEMSALSIFLQGTTSQRQYPHHYVDSAVTIYLQTCHAPELALRATLLNAEALASRGLYAESAMCLLRLTSEDDDLTSALLIEQTAHYVLQQRRPLLRKFAFRMALAAHRYSRAKQPHLSIRCYRLAAPVLSARGWSLIEDHINYNVGKQAYLIGDLAASANALRESLMRPSQQPIERQSLFVREYLVVLKKYLTNCATQGQPALLPEFPLPVVQLKDIKAMLGKPTRASDGMLLFTFVQRLIPCFLSFSYSLSCEFLNTATVYVKR